MQKTHEHSYQMNAWNLPQQINPGQSPSTYVEFSEGFFQNAKDDAGETNYVLTGSNDGSGAAYWFQVRVRFRNISVDVKNMAARVLPAPVPPQSALIDLGWSHDGEVSFALLDLPSSGGSMVQVEIKPVRRYPTPEESAQIYTEIKMRIGSGVLDESRAGHLQAQAIAAEMFPERDLILRSSSGDPGSPMSAPEGQLISASSTYWLRSWMWQYQQFLGRQKITDLILPGTHDSGTYDMLSPFGEPWTQCQNLDLKGQLEAGARALDIRTGIQADKDGDEKFILVHEDWRTKITMANALNQVMGFCNENQGEIVILDYHRFTDLNGANDFVYAELIQLIKDKLGKKLIPPGDKDKTLNQLLQGAGRVIVSWNRDGGPAEFWPGVDQEWFDKATKADLFDAMATFYNGAQPTGLWACCAVITPDFPHISAIQSLNPEIGVWFAPDGAWAQKSFIVSCDFIETTQLAQALVQASIVKVTQVK